MRFHRTTIPQKVNSITGINNFPLKKRRKRKQNNEGHKVLPNTIIDDFSNSKSWVLKGGDDIFSFSLTVPMTSQSLYKASYNMSEKS